MYKNTNLSSSERAADLLSKMTIDEKLDQIIFYRLIHEIKEE